MSYSSISLWTWNLSLLLWTWDRTSFCKKKGLSSMCSVMSCHVVKSSHHHTTVQFICTNILHQCVSVTLRSDRLIQGDEFTELNTIIVDKNHLMLLAATNLTCLLPVFETAGFSTAKTALLSLCCSCRCSSHHWWFSTFSLGHPLQIPTWCCFCLGVRKLRNACVSGHRYGFKSGADDHFTCVSVYVQQEHPNKFLIVPC